jgi:hypothetical protein
LHVAAGLVKTIIDAHGIENIAKVAKVRKNPDRALGPASEPFLHQVSNRGIERQTRVAEVVAPPEPGYIRPFHGPQHSSLEHVVEFSEIKVHHEEGISELVLDRLVAEMSDVPGINAALHSLFPK